MGFVYEKPFEYLFLGTLVGTLNIYKVIQYRVLSSRDVKEIVEWFKSKGVSVEVIGESWEGKSIWSLRLGKGDLKVLSICRLHGNEPASTNGALLFAYHVVEKGFMRGFPLKKFLEKVSVYLIPLANPDGADSYYEKFKERSEPSWQNAFSDTRVNSRGVDLNRDWLFLEEKETQVLHAFINKIKPHIILDQHEFYFKGGYPPQWPSGKDEFMITLTDAPYYWVSQPIFKLSENVMNNIALTIENDWPHWPISKRWFLGGGKGKPGEIAVAPIYLGSHFPYENIAKVLVETWGVGLGEYLMWDRAHIHAMAIASTVQWIYEHGDEVLRLIKLSYAEDLKLGVEATYIIKGRDLEIVENILRLHGIAFRKNKGELRVSVPQERTRMALILLDRNCEFNKKLREKGLEYTLDARFDVEIEKLS